MLKASVAFFSLTVQFVFKTCQILACSWWQSLFLWKRCLWAKFVISLSHLRAGAESWLGQPCECSRGNLSCLHRLLPALWAGRDNLHRYFVCPRYVLDVGQMGGGPRAHPQRAVTSCCRQGVRAGQNSADFRLPVKATLTWGARYIIHKEVFPFIKEILFTFSCQNTFMADELHLAR